VLSSPNYLNPCPLSSSHLLSLSTFFLSLTLQLSYSCLCHCERDADKRYIKKNIYIYKKKTPHKQPINPATRFSKGRKRNQGESRRKKTRESITQHNNKNQSLKRLDQRVKWAIFSFFLTFIHFPCSG